MYGSLCILNLYMKPEHHPESWPGLSRTFVKEALQPGPLWMFVKISLGGVLSLLVSESCVLFQLGIF